jgi:hypothetical protein
MEEKRTINQNSAMHLYFQMIADSLNSIGIDVHLFLEILSRNGIDSQFTPHLVKELVWRKAQKKILGKQSTKELSKYGEIDLIVDALNKFFSENFGKMGYEFVPFPSFESYMTQLEEETSPQVKI